MIYKTFEINKVNLNNYNFYLLYGENEGFKNEIIKKKFEINYPKQIFKYDEKEILENKDNFYNNILTNSLFENKKLIIISRSTDKIKSIIEEIIFKDVKDIKIILLADILEKKSKLRSFFEKEKNTVCIAFYADNAQTLNNIAINFFREKNISISQININLIVERSRGSRSSLNSELEKIEQYATSGKKINTNDILKLSNLSENYEVSELTDNCLAKNTKKTAHILNENNFSPEDCILIIRTLLIKAKRLMRILEEIEKNQNIDNIIKNFKPPIFWKDKDIVKKQISQRSLLNIKKMIFKINDIEFLVKKNSSNSLNILSDFLLAQARINN
tara:strand:- start:5 stop:997 length:993 start_codon:yes stop_codon:yes gene_type:complete